MDLLSLRLGNTVRQGFRVTRNPWSIGVAGPVERGRAALVLCLVNLDIALQDFGYKFRQIDAWLLSLAAVSFAICFYSFPC